MKKILSLLFMATLVLACFVACDKEKDKNKKPTEQPTKQEFNEFAAINLPIVENKTKSGKYDAKTIYENAAVMHFNMLDHDGALEIEPSEGTMIGCNYFSYRDTIEKELAIRGDFVLHQPCEGCPYEFGEFITLRNMVLSVILNEDGSVFDQTEWVYAADWDCEEYNEFVQEFYKRALAVINNTDTVAYIPNALMDSLQPLMEEAFAKGSENNDWSELFYLFKNGYKFIPISGEEYRELVRQGKN